MADNKADASNALIIFMICLALRFFVGYQFNFEVSFIPSILRASSALVTTLLPRMVAMSTVIFTTSEFFLMISSLCGYSQ